MTKQQAIDLARGAYDRWPNTFEKLRPIPWHNGQWALLVVIVPKAQFEHEIQNECLSFFLTQINAYSDQRFVDAANLSTAYSALRPGVSDQLRRSQKPSAIYLNGAWAVADTPNVPIYR